MLKHRSSQGARTVHNGRSRQMEFLILGPLEVRQDGQALSLGGAKQRAVLAILLLEANRVVAVERLAELLWGDKPPPTAAHAIEVYISQLRRTLEPDGSPYRLLLTGPAGYSLRIDAGSIDATRFQRLVDSAAELSLEDRKVQLTKALALWRGAALADFAAESFAIGEAARLGELRVHAIEERIDADLALGRHAVVVGELVALTGEHPLRERLSGQLMVALYRSGRQAEASDVYQRTRERLVEELGMEPGPNLQSLLRQIVTQDPALTVRLPAPNLEEIRQPLTNLPSQTTSFVGRLPEVAGVKASIDEFRLVTLIGVGGSGKTRLALQTAEDLIDRFADGVWFVDLAPLTDTAMVPQAIASSLGIREQPGHALLSSVIDHLQRKAALLLLDNCEHLIEGVATATETLLSACRDLRVLATSRERLRIGGEQLHQVPPLAIPPPGAHMTASALSSFESCELFIQRARQSRPSFSVDDTNAQDVAELCRRLDGIPLAIELAAVQVSAFTPREVVANMGERFAILASGDRARPPKQRTLWATLDWSHRLLNESERTVFRRLSEFSGGFDLEAAKDVVAFGSITPASVPTLVARLTEQSLVVADSEVGGVTRYRLLETVRQFSADLLSASGEVDAVHDRHSAHYLAFARDRQPLRSSDVADWRSTFAREEDNFRSALARLRTRDPNQGLQLATWLAQFWLAAGRLKEGRSWLETMLSAGPSTDKRLLSAAGYQAGSLAYFDGDYVAASTLIAESIKLKHELGDARGAAQQLGLLAAITQARGDGSRAIQLGEEGQTLARQLGDPWVQAWATLFLAWILYFDGNLSRASDLFHETVGPLRTAHDYNGLGFALCGPLLIDAQRGQFESARRYAREVIEMVREHRVYLEPTGHMGVFVLLAEAEGRDDAVSRLWGAALRMEREGRLIDGNLRLKDQLAADRAKERLGVERFEQLLAEGAAMSHEALMAEALKEPDRSFK